MSKHCGVPLSFEPRDFYNDNFHLFFISYLILVLREKLYASPIYYGRLYGKIIQEKRLSKKQEASQSPLCTVLKWSCVWANTARSASFEANDRLLMGRRLENSASAPVFFNPGLTSASFQSSGKVPHCRERLIILVTTGRRVSRHSTTRGVGWVKATGLLARFPN